MGEKANKGKKKKMDGKETRKKDAVAGVKRAGRV